MKLALDTFLLIVGYTFPFSLVWGIGGIAYRSVVDALSGKDVFLR